MKKYVVAFALMVSIIFLVSLISHDLMENPPTRNEFERSLTCPDCNVILISIDTLRADSLGVYGYERNTSPYIDEFARNAIVFENAYAQAPWTLPSHMSMLTGLYTSRHGVINKSLKLGNSTLTLADVLHNEGYFTAAFTGGGFVSSGYNYHTFDVFDDSGGSSGENFDSMIGWLDNHSNERFFLLWHDYQPHVFYEPPGEFDVFSDKNYSGIAYKFTNECMEPGSLKKGCEDKDLAFYRNLQKKLSDVDLEYLKAKYDGEILYVDKKFLKIMSMLRRKMILDKTIVVFTSDHGESFALRNKKKRHGHNLMYETVLRIPLIIRVPGSGQQVRVKNVVESVDIMPSVLEILGVEVPNDLDGESLFDSMNEPNRREVAYSETFEGNKTEYAIRYGNLKMIYKKRKHVFELYDLDKDPFERNDIFGVNTSRENEVKEMLLSKISGRIYLPEETVMDNKTIEQLRELGYIGK